jgi:electron transfer flavoprotein beta subunit
MKILVCISCVPDTTSKVSFTDDNKFNKENIQFIIGPYEDYALARAVELKEKNSEIDISILNVGLSENDPLLRKGLAIGADRAYRINSEPNNSNFVAHNIASFIKKNNFDLVLMGKESIDYNSGLVHYLSGALLDIQTFNPVTYLEIDNNNVIIKRETESGIEKIKASLPLILGCQEPIAEWKIPNMRGIMNARTKELSVIEPISVQSSLKHKKYSLPPEKEEIKYVDKDNLEVLINELKLKNL